MRRTSSLILREELTDSGRLRKECWRRRDEVIGKWRNLSK
jgi:hypothetical protein